MPFIPHTVEEVKHMLATIGVANTEALFDEIPENLRCQPFDNLPTGMNELDLTQFLQKRAEQDSGLICFLGAGAYEHHIPAAVWDITSRGEFYTAYTPYQAEASQGTLQLLYEYQTMIVRLMAMEVANASLYDGGSALAEAVLMAVRCQSSTKAGKNVRRILVPQTLHPYYRAALQTIVGQQNVELIEVPYDPKQGITLISVLKNYQKNEITALIIPQPNFFGNLESVDELTDAAHALEALVIGVVNPIAMSLLKPPGKWGSTGADIVCGEGQPLGIPLSSGGPYFGFFCARQVFVRQMPGRIIGRTVDQEGKTGFALTLQAREQHIRRAKATSNICTNQGLMVTAATIFLSLVGAEGLRRMALVSHQRTQELAQALTSLPGIERAFDKPFFHEVVLRSKNMPVSQLLNKLDQAGILGGIALGDFYPELADCWLVCATEVRTTDDIEKYKNDLALILKNT
ncbi:MAG: aminomethyl-transferring glycine dehydrogenase subunit GcvPA [Gammaproteobacteria bacterium]